MYQKTFCEATRVRYTCAMQEEKKGKKERLSWVAFWHMIGPAFRGTFWSYAGIVVLITIAAMAQVAEPVIFGLFVDAIIVHPETVVERVIPLIGWWVVAFLVSIGMSHWAQWLSWRIGHKVNGAFFSIMMKKVMAWDPDRFGRESSGAIAKRVDQAWERSYDVASRVLIDVLPQIIGFIVVLVTGLILDWRMTLASLVMIPVVAFVTLRVYRRTQMRQDALGDSWESLSTELYEILNNILPIKIFSGEQRALRQIERRSEDVAQRQIAIDKVWGALGATNGLLRLSARLCVIGVGVYFISRGETTFGIVTTFLGMLNQLLSPFDYLLADVLRRARRTQSAFARLQKDWQEESLIVQTARPKRLPSVRGEIAFQDVSYRYLGKNRDALKGINLSIPAGTSLALVGRSGSGKSTLVKFINRFLDPTSGSVSIDGIDLKEVKIADVRNVVGIVQQDTVLFNESILDNIRFARPKATKQQIEAACKAAQAHDFITKLPKGYETIVGERGVKLSGGERQRLSLARVFLADPPILVLDESTSALDSETEALVQEALAKVMKGRTTIVIAHRLSTVYMADRIAVLDAGKIVEIGTHAELMNKGGMYDRLWKLQSGGYLPE